MISLRESIKPYTGLNIIDTNMLVFLWYKQKYYSKYTYAFAYSQDDFY